MDYWRPAEQHLVSGRIPYAEDRRYTEPAGKTTLHNYDGSVTGKFQWCSGLATRRLSPHYSNSRWCCLNGKELHSRDCWTTWSGQWMDLWVPTLMIWSSIAALLEISLWVAFTLCWRDYWGAGLTAKLIGGGILSALGHIESILRFLLYLDTCNSPIRLSGYEISSPNNALPCAGVKRGQFSNVARPRIL